MSASEYRHPIKQETSIMLRTGEEVGIAKLRKLYDPHVFQVLRGRFEELPRQRKQQRRYKVRQDTPTKEEYLRMKAEHFSTTVETLMADAYGEITSLAEEMREWHDNMPENLQDGDVGSRVSEAADSLENVDEQSYPEELPEIKTVFYPSIDCSSRSDRACEAASQLRSAAEVMREWLEEEDQATLPEDDRTAISQLADEIEGHADDLEAVEFPTMFG